LRTYLRTALLFITSSILFGIAVVAYTSFYYAYIPIRGISVPVYLQYDHTSHIPLSLPPPPTLAPSPNTSPANTNTPVARTPRHPYGIANIHGLVSRQKYDVVVEMDVPRSERNLDAGNWMVGVDIRGSATAGGGVKGVLGWEEEWAVEDYSLGGRAGKLKEKTTSDEANGEEVEKPVVLARSKRPAILIYRSWMTELAYRTLRLPLYVLGFGMESETVVINMMEGVEFEKGWRNVPSSLRLEIRSKTPLEVYRASVRFAAKLEGLRWVMYTHRLASFAVFTSLFWAVEMGVVLLTWAVFSFCLAGAEDEDDTNLYSATKKGAATPKSEPADSAPPSPLSDASRTFPTLSSHHPLRYMSPNEGKSKEDKGTTPRLEDVPIKTEQEADDEDDDFLLDDAGLGRDSGLGTSMDSGVERTGVARRRSGGGRKRDR
jgi:seipin